MIPFLLKAWSSSSLLCLIYWLMKRLMAGWLCLSNSRAHYLPFHFGNVLSSAISLAAFWGLRESFNSSLMRIVISCPEFQLKFNHEHFLHISLEAVANGWYYCWILSCSPLWTTTVTQSSVPVTSFAKNSSKREVTYNKSQPMFS